MPPPTRSILNTLVGLGVAGGVFAFLFWALNRDASAVIATSSMENVVRGSRGERGPGTTTMHSNRRLRRRHARRPLLNRHVA